MASAPSGLSWTALLVVEVADTSLAYDREQKLPLYARCGLPEALLVDLNRPAVEVHRDPSPQGYRSRAVLRHGHSLTLLALPAVRLAVADLLP
jgi:Uma2 family endonuclease